MFEDIGECTLCEFDVIDSVKDVSLGYLAPSAVSDSEDPIVVHIHDAFPTPSTPSSSPYTPFFSHSAQDASPQPPRPRAGRILSAADFRPIRVLGKGGHGTVYLVEDAVSERRLAMKVIGKNGLRLREYPAVFEEQMVMQALATGAGDTERPGPWFVPLVGSFEDSDNFYFLMEHFPRGDLMNEMKENGVVPVHQARLWCAELLVAIEDLHKRRIVHRDIKLDNILLDEDNHIVLTDFGIARAFGMSDADRAWKRVPPWNGSQEQYEERERAARAKAKGKSADETHSLVGTPGYVAPEVYSGTYSYEVDVWGVGVVLYCMLTGRLPFGLQPKEQRLEEVIARTDSLPADLDLLGLVDIDVRDLLVKMLEKDPRRRPSVRKLKKHPWFRGIKWDAIERRGPRRDMPDLSDDPQWDEDIYLPCGRQYGALDKLPHEWFEWVSPSLQGGDQSYDTTNEWSLGSTCFMECDISRSDEHLAPTSPVGNTEVRRRPTIVQRMKGWLKRRMSFP